MNVPVDTDDAHHFHRTGAAGIGGRFPCSRFGEFHSPISRQKQKRESDRRSENLDHRESEANPDISHHLGLTCETANAGKGWIHFLRPLAFQHTVESQFFAMLE
jgi:hypothetical protein